MPDSAYTKIVVKRYTFMSTSESSRGQGLEPPDGEGWHVLSATLQSEGTDTPAEFVVFWVK